MVLACVMVIAHVMVLASVILFFSVVVLARVMVLNPCYGIILCYGFIEVQLLAKLCSYQIVLKLPKCPSAWLSQGRVVEKCAVTVTSKLSPFF